jgi:hypothetical protein
MCVLFVALFQLEPSSFMSSNHYKFIDIMPLFRYINNIKVINSLSSFFYKFFNAVPTLVNNYI